MVFLKILLIDPLRQQWRGLFVPGNHTSTSAPQAGLGLTGPAQPFPGISSSADATYVAGDA